MDYLKLAVSMILTFLLSAIYCMSIHAMNGHPSANIVINLPSYTIGYYENNELIQEYPIAIGKPSTPTPCGFYKIKDKEINPCWYPPDKIGYIVPSGPSNPLGYRWMGFESNYGIHGTNAPWSIGSAVSNGCIRMYEEDVEQLFEQVQYNTPLSIIYERIYIKVDQMGQVTIEKYPDIYGYQDITVEKVKYQLIKKHVENLIDDEFLSNFIIEGKKDKVVVANVSKIEINNQKLEEYLVWWEGILYAPVERIGAYLDCPIEWDEKKQLIIGQQHTIPGFVKNHVLYAKVEDLSKLFDVVQKWDQDSNCLQINAPTVLIDGQFVTHNVQIKENILYLPINKVTQPLERKIDWDEQSQTLWLGYRKIAFKKFGDELYIEAGKISDYFNLNILCDDTLKTINITSFCCAIDYSMYLGEMGDFVD